VLKNPVLVFLTVVAASSALAVPLGVPVSRVTEIVIYTLYGAGVNLLLGYTGLVPFGAALFFGCASYAAALGALRIVPSEFFGLACALVVSVLLGLAVGPIVLRRSGIYFALLTLAFSQIAFEIAFKWTSLTGGENGLQNVPRPVLQSAWAFHVFAVLSVAAALLVMWRLVHAPVGRVFQAIRDNEQRASALGYNVFRYKLAAFVASGTLVGYAGGLLAFMLQGAYATPLSWQHAGDPLLMTVFGGVHHFLGPLWGAITFILLQDRLSALYENWWLVFAPIVIVFTLLSSEGLHGVGQRLIGRKARWTLIRTGTPRKPDVIAPLADARVGSDDGGPILTVRGLGKRFGSIVTADNIDLDVYPGRLHSLIGPNGAGKTTLFNMLTGLVKPDAGIIVFAGQDITALPVHRRIRCGLARSFQIISLFRHLTAFEAVRLAVQANSPQRFGVWHDAHRLDQVVARTWSVLMAVGLQDRAGEVCADLAHGEQRLLDIAMTLATNARLLLLDEPLAGLAEADRQTVGVLIRNLSRSHGVVLIEHDIDRVLELSDEVSVLHQGQLIAQGAPRDVARDPKVVAAYLGNMAPATPAEITPISAHKTSRPILVLEKVSAGYEGSVVLQNLDLTLNEGEVVALLGRNGVGKTTTLRAIAGTAAVVGGRIGFDGNDITRGKPHAIARAGIAMVPEGRRLFPNLTVWENLKIAQRPGGTSLDDAYALFPRLQARRDQLAETLSGGERQMLAIARALMAPNRVLLLDEPFEGLAPSVVQEVMQAVIALRGRVSIILVEHNAEIVLPIADRACVLVNGAIAFDGPAHGLASDHDLQNRLLGVAQAAAQ
jgi:ABC-type branched-subunit amino acid transport system ATPase component/ABC-type branched-subunit amino acid transport system permease subunit